MKTNHWSDFYKLSRLIIKEYGAGIASGLVEIAIEDLANDTWNKKPFPYKTKEEKVKIKIDPNAKLLKDKIKITDLAKLYGLKVKKNKVKCPFHEDTIPSLSLSDKKGVFYCFGCGVKGDLITFVRKLEELENEKRRS